MSLINDALKKAARQRAEEQADLSSLMPGGGSSRASQHSGPASKQTMVVIGASAVALAVVSAIITGVVLSGHSSAPAAPEAQASAPAVQPAPAKVAAAPVVAVTLPRVEFSAPSPRPVPTAVPTATPTMAPTLVAAAALAPAAAGAEATSAADRVQAFVDGLHVTGARAAGADSKALVDGHVFKINDIVDKALGIRLTAVDADHLTFMDRSGNTFQKSY
jgi:hypothetical protein